MLVLSQDSQLGNHGLSCVAQVRSWVRHINNKLHSSRMRTARALTVSPSMLCVGGFTWSRGCTWSRGVYLVLGMLYLVLGGVPGPGGCTWSWGVYLVPGGVPGPEGVLGPGGCTWSRGVCTWSGGVAGPGGCSWSQGVYLVQGGTWSQEICTWSGTPTPC